MKRALALGPRADAVFHVWPGDHSAGYWKRHTAQYLRFYSDACASRLGACASSGEPSAR